MAQKRLPKVDTKTAFPTRLPGTRWVAVRAVPDEGYQWVDTGTLSSTREEVVRQVNRDNALIPAWAKVNPLVAIVQCHIILHEDAK